MNMEMSKVWSEMGDYYKHFEISICINKPSLTIFALPPKVNISFYSGKIKMTKKNKQTKKNVQLGLQEQNKLLRFKT